MQQQHSSADVNAGFSLAGVYILFMFSFFCLLFCFIRYHLKQVYSFLLPGIWYDMIWCVFYVCTSGRLSGSGSLVVLQQCGAPDWIKVLLGCCCAPFVKSGFEIEAQGGGPGGDGGGEKGRGKESRRRLLCEPWRWGEVSCTVTDQWLSQCMLNMCICLFLCCTSLPHVLQPIVSSFSLYVLNSMPP